jgi:hypothetical protein
MKVRPAEPDRQAEIDFAKGVAGSLQDKADAIEKQFGTKHDKSTISKWLKGFDQEAAWNISAAVTVIATALAK